MIIIILTWIFGIVSIVGLLSTLYYGRKAARLEKDRQTLTWEDIVVASDDLASQITKSGFQPDLFLATSARGAIIAHMMAGHFTQSSPVLVGIVEWKDEALFQGDLSNYDAINTSKVRIYIPKTVYANKECRVLLVDDFAMSGNGMAEARDRLIANEFQSSAVKTVTLIASTVAIASHGAPDFYWKKVDTLDFFFPWGRAR